MAQISYRANLSSAIFPLSISAAGPTVIVPGPDNNYDRRVDPEGEQKDAGIPQAIYLENVIPTANGYQSVGKNESYSLTSYPSSPGNVVVNQIPVLEPGGNNIVYTGTLIYIGSPAQYRYAPYGAGAWTFPVFVGAIAYPNRYSKISFAIVRGVCYVLIVDTGVTYLYTAELSFGNLVLTNVSASVTHVTLNDIVTICGSYNYLLMFTAAGTCYWSSTTNPLDFVPSLVSGAGSATPNGLYGNLSYSHATSFGFYLFSRVGVSAGIYTGNSRFPWKFELISDTNTVNSVGVQDPNSGRVLIYDAAYNFSILSDTTATQVAPELSSFLRSNRTDHIYDYSTNRLQSITPSHGVSAKVYSYYDRYICVSTSNSAVDGKFRYNVLIIYDTHLRRYGRLVHPHTDVVIVQDFVTAQLSFGVINVHTGNICVFSLVLFPSFNLPQIDTTKSVIMLGKFKYVRSRRIELQEIKIEGQFGDSSVRVSEGTLQAMTSSSELLAPVESTSYTRTYNCRKEGDSVAVSVLGQFALDSLELTLSLGGSR